MLFVVCRVAIAVCRLLCIGGGVGCLWFAVITSVLLLASCSLRLVPWSFFLVGCCVLFVDGWFVGYCFFCRLYVGVCCVMFVCLVIVVPCVLFVVCCLLCVVCLFLFVGLCLWLVA